MSECVINPYKMSRKVHTKDTFHCSYLWRCEWDGRAIKRNFYYFLHKLLNNLFLFFFFFHQKHIWIIKLKKKRKERKFVKMRIKDELGPGWPQEFSFSPAV